MTKGTDGINILLLNDKDEVLTAYTFSDVKKDDVITIDKNDYKVTNAEKGIRTFSGQCVIIDLEKWKENHLTSR